MVAIVSGNSLGLNLTSKGVQGGDGVQGDPNAGNGAEQVYVNAATGNLVLQQVQDELVAAGLDVPSVLTYNSLGALQDDNKDNFTLGATVGVAQMAVASGTINATGRALRRIAFDGSQQTFTWDASKSRYVCINGTGAFDTVTWSGSTYTWIDGATQVKETYNAAGQLTTRTDAAGNTLTFSYAAGQLTGIADASGESVTYAYAGTMLQSITAPVTVMSGGAPVTNARPVVSYAYDTSNRLKSVTVDLTPADGSIADGKTYVTSFTYDGASTRVATMTQTDGTSLSFLYDASQRVQSITDALGNKTTFAYDLAGHKTTVTANGQAMVYGWDAATGLLTSVTGPVSATPVASYTYNASGQLRRSQCGSPRHQ